MNTVLVTGAAGFIGSHVTEKLLDKGYKVIGIDNFDIFYSRQIKERNLINIIQRPNFQFIESDIRNRENFRTICISNKIESIIHLAARAGVRPSIVDPTLYISVNIDGTVNILETMKECGIKKLVFASSSSVYGDTNTVPYSETQNTDYPVSPYAATKKACELFCSQYSTLYNLNISCLRFFTAYGPRQRPEMAIHKFVRHIVNELPIEMYGDGTTARDYTYISDIVDGIIASLNYLSGFEIYNLGESSSIPLIKLIRLLEEILHKKAIVNNLPMQSGDVHFTFADISKAKTKLHYNPSIGIETGLQYFCDWYKKENNVQV
ncbi:MAG: GDP-mannose 4,6-dehydratase [Bacteroidetes bacterium]|nr:GDP-mannose 4,6-dehydratase [Bacteroidota bacterium]